MKKTIIIVLAVAWAVANFTGPALAAEGPRIFLDFLYGNDSVATDESGSSSGGTYTQNIDQTTVLSGFLLGVVYPWHAFDFGLEYGAGQTKDYAGAKTDLNLGRLKAGYRLRDGKPFTIIPYLGWLSLKAGGSQYGGAEMGIDLQYDIAAKLRLSAGVGYVPKSNVKNNSEPYNDTGLWDYRLKAEYALNDHWNLGLGYRAYQYSGQYSSYTDSDNYSNLSLDGCTDLLTLGVTYKFPAVEDQKAQKALAEQKALEEQKVQAVQEVKKVNEFLKPIFFDFNSASIRPDQQWSLDSNVQALQSHADMYILIGGHADEQGDNAYNTELSRKRAQAVADYLTAHGVKAERITIIAYGKEHPEAKGAGTGFESDRWVDTVVTVEKPDEEMGIRR